EIAADFDQGLSGSEPGLVAYFTFDDNYLDTAGGNNNGAAVGDALVDGGNDAPVAGLGGPVIVQFSGSPQVYEGNPALFSWEVDSSLVVGDLLVEILDPLGAIIHTSSATNDVFQGPVADTAGNAEQRTYTLRASESAGAMVTRSAFFTLAVLPGIPTADDQLVTARETNVTPITLSAIDPDDYPNPGLSYTLVRLPAHGSVTGAPPNVIYQADAEFEGRDTFTFRVNDGRYDSPIATLTVDVLPALAPPDDIHLNEDEIPDNVYVGGFLATLSTDDVNKEEGHLYSFVAGPGDTDNASFTIAGDQLKANVDFSSAVGQVSSIRVRSTDDVGLWIERMFSLTVVNVSQQLVINEIHFNSPTNNLLEEFIEIYNPGPTNVNLLGYRLSSAVDVVFTNVVSIASGGYLVLAENAGMFQTRFGFAPDDVYAGLLSSDGETIRLRNAANRVIDEADYAVGFPWPVASDGQGASAQLINPVLDNALGSSWRAGTPTPGALNAPFAANAPPNIRKVSHSPNEPLENDPVVITARVTDPDGVASVRLEFQIVLAGEYVPAFLPHAIVGNRIPDYALPRMPNPAYTNNWTSYVMSDLGGGDKIFDEVAGDGIYSVRLDDVYMPHRSLARYRILVEDNLGASIQVPYADDDSLNFAFYVYDGVPDYNGHAATNLTTLPVYQVLTRDADWRDCHAWDPSRQIAQGGGNRDRFLYNWSATFVYDGVVYDNIRYRLRGANGRYLGIGKRSMRFRFHDGSFFQARDETGEKFNERWRTLTTGKGSENRGTLTYGLNERVNMVLWDKLGLPAQKLFWAHLRVVDDMEEAPDPWRGDFWGTTLVLETYDVNFIDEHKLPKGNLYKLINQERGAIQQRRYLASTGVGDGSDHDTIENNLTGFSGEAFIREHVELDKWFLYKGFSEAIRNYDFWPSANKNMVYYFHPTYTPGNNGLGKLWILPWDSDATWGPTWNAGHDVVYNAIFPAGGGGSDAGSTPAIWPAYYNVVREIRDLLWQPDQLNPLIDQFAAELAPIIDADSDRWKNAPADAGSYNGLSGAGSLSLEALVGDMKAFAFFGGQWPGDNAPIVSRATHLDTLLASNGQGGQVPNTPTISYVGTPGFPTSTLAFQSSVFSDPQGSGTFGSMEWRLAEVTNTNAPNYDPAEPIKLEVEAKALSGALTPFEDSYTFPAQVVDAGSSYRVRVRHTDSDGYASHWSDPIAFTASLPDLSGYTNSLVISEIMYNPPEGPAYEWIEIYNVGAIALDLSNVRFTKGVDFDFAASAITSLASGARVLIVSDQLAFESKYGTNLLVAGEWDAGDQLNNDGERLKLSFGAGEAIHDFTFGDSAPWPSPPDGHGYAMVLVRPETAPDHVDPTQWRSSLAVDGTPGSAEVTQVFLGSPTADLDNDRLLALAEYATGLNEGDASDAHRALSIGRDQVIRYRRALDAEDVIITLELSRDLQLWMQPLDDESMLQWMDSIVVDGIETLQAMPVGQAVLYARLNIQLRP
ncbi:MAG: hypothetical protein ACI9TH_004618, partial [Kiritimatiellia bacterium]